MGRWQSAAVCLGQTWAVEQCVQQVTLATLTFHVMVVYVSTPLLETVFTLNSQTILLIDQL